MRKIILCSVFLAIFRFAAVPAWALGPSLPPGSNFDLSHWYLQLPVDSNGTNVGTSASISTAQLTNGYTSAWFYTATNDGAMTFWVPDNGATTSGSTHPRSELREELSPGNTSVNWTPYGTHILTATCVVSNVPSDTLKVCIGQVHEQVSGGDVVPMVMIMFVNNSKIYVNVWPDGNVDSSSSYNYGTLSMGTPITYQIAVTNGVLSVTINNSNKTFNLFGAGYANWQTNQVYFKAGAYSQTTNQCNCATDGAKVAFYSLTRYHAPSITSPPANQIVTAGQNAAFAVGANGNGTLGYQWQFNATNTLAGATNALLTITNAQSTNAGNYSVVVTDSIGSVTSAVATLTVNVGTSSTLARSNYQSVIIGQSPSYYFKFDGNLVDAIGGTATFTANGGATFGGDYFGNANDAASFPAATSGLTLSSPVIINGAGSTASSGSLSLLFDLTAATGTEYLFSDSENTSGTGGSTGAAHSAFALDFSSGTFQLKAGNKSIADATLPAPAAGSWYYFACTWNFNGTTNDQINWWIGPVGGTLISGDNISTGNRLSSDATLGDSGTFVLGNRRALNNSPTGEFDELATWSTQLNASQIASQFSALTVSTGPPPRLGIAASGTNAIISWLSSTDPGFVLQSTTNLASSTWSSVGTPVTIGGQFVVTNAILPNAQFYLLKK
jgi:hypothetical protein